MPRPGVIAATLSLAVASALPILAQESPLRLRYDLRPGDHLVYRQVLERRASPTKLNRDARSFATRMEWKTHVLVVDAENGQLLIGFQRNRVAAELLSYSENGKDKLSEQREIFARNIANRSPYFAEANRFTQQGWPQLPDPALREGPSLLLIGLRELEPLPTDAVGPGSAWWSSGWLGLEYRVTAWEALGEQECLRVEGTGHQAALQLRYWFCPDSGIVPRLEFEGRYGLFGLLFNDEKITWELAEHRRDEDPEGWLTDPDLQQGTLAAVTLATDPLVDLNAIYALLETGSAEVQRRVLALAFRHRLSPPPVPVLNKLLAGEEARVRTLAVRLLEKVPTSQGRPLVERALKDEDYFVRQAALAWARGRLPTKEAIRLKAPADVSRVWNEMSDSPVLRPGQSLPRSAATGSLLPASGCGDTNDWGERTLLAQRFHSKAPGTTWRQMTAEEFKGRPYVLHVPEDYRGDEPFPLLIYLSGSGGRAAEGALSARGVLPGYGYLVVFPDAQNNWWWTPEPPHVVAALLTEVLQEFNVDTNRVYLAGFSAGGTGTFYYSILWSDRFAAAASLMGGGIYEFPSQRPPLVNVSALPMIFVHGEKDPTIPVFSTHDTVREMRRAGRVAPLEVHTLDGRGHDVLLGNDDGLTLPFLQEHVRDPFPRKIEFHALDLRFPRHFWVEIVEKDDGTAEVEGEIHDDNTVEIKTRRVRRLRLLLRRELLPQAGPMRVRLNGKEVFNAPLPEDCHLLQETWQQTGDPFRAYSVLLEFDVP